MNLNIRDRFRKAMPARLASASLSIGTASAFVVATAALSLAVDRPLPAKLGTGWVLRGAIAPADPAGLVAPARAANQKVPSWT